MAAPGIFHELKTLVRSAHPVVMIESAEEERVDDLLRALAAELRLPLFTWTVTTGLQRIDGGGTIHATADPRILLRHIASLTVAGIFHLKDLATHLTAAQTARAFREAAHACTTRGSTMVLSGYSVALPDEISREAVRLQLHLPDRNELKQVVHRVVRSLRAQPPVEVSLGPDAMEAVLNAVAGLTLNQARQALARAVLDDNRLTADDIPQLLKRKGASIGDTGVLEFYPPEDNTFELGGFARLTEWLARAEAGFSDEARAIGLRAPRGVLFVGVQGCGKSLAAKTIARKWRQPLLKLDAGRLYDKFVGESEKNLRKAFEVAEAIAPAVLWIDELEKAFATGSDADAGLSRRMLGSFLTWLQERTSPVFVAATANDLSRVPPELLRKGRFDEIFFVDLPTAPEREAILRIHLELRKQDPSAFDLAAVSNAAEGFSGAEIEQAVVSALYRALHEKQPLTTMLLLHEMSQTSPLSVSRREDVERLREAASHFVPVA
jgi:SpoVK/Ycf46/Vps4 family AAA+-type ATPase